MRNAACVSTPEWPPPINAGITKKTPCHRNGHTHLSGVKLLGHLAPERQQASARFTLPATRKVQGTMENQSNPQFIKAKARAGKEK